MSVDSRASPVPVSLEEENAGLKAENKRLMSLVSKQREKIKDARLSPTTLMDENKGVEEVEGESDEPKEKAAWPVDDGRHPHGRPKDEMTVRYRFADYLMHELVKRRVSSSWGCSWRTCQALCFTSAFVCLRFLSLILIHSRFTSSSPPLSAADNKEASAVFQQVEAHGREHEDVELHQEGEDEDRLRFQLDQVGKIEH